MRSKRWTLLAAGILVLWATTAQAQSCLGRPDFDACMARINSANQARTTAAQQQLWRNYLQTNGPWLRQQYSQYRGPMSFQQFAYWNLMTAYGTNIAGAAKAQQDQFQGNQRAHETIQQGNDSYKRGMYDNSARTSRTAENYNQGAIRGNTAVIDPRSGQRQWLPYAQPYNQPFTSGGQTYIQNEKGYYQWTGNGWTLMQPGR